MDILSDVNISGSLDVNSVGATFGSFTHGICGYDLNFQRGNLSEELCIGSNISIKPCGIIESGVTDSININSLYIYKGGSVSAMTINSNVVNSDSLCVSEFYYGEGLNKHLQPYYRNYEVTVPPECSKFRLYSAATNSFTLLDYPPIIQSVSQATGRFIYTDYEIICGNETGSIWHVNVLITPESEDRDLNFAVFSF